jgi:hypothetical protein
MSNTTLNSQDNVILNIRPTIFIDLNKKNGLAADHHSTTITVNRLKHKHLRVMQKLAEVDQMNYILSELTGLSEVDLDELDAEDSAALTEVIFDFMKKYAEIARKMPARV